MRKLALLVAADTVAVVPFFGPGVLAHGRGSGHRPVCPVPTVTTDYNVGQLTVHVAPPAGRCAARQRRVFDLGVAVTRMDNHASHDTPRSATSCGPFPSAGAVDPRYSCGLGMAVDHPPVEAAQYVIDVTYPGAAGDETAHAVVFCRSGSGKAACEQLDTRR